MLIRDGIAEDAHRVIVIERPPPRRWLLTTGVLAVAVTAIWLFAR